MRIGRDNLMLWMLLMAFASPVEGVGLDVPSKRVCSSMEEFSLTVSGLEGRTDCQVSLDGVAGREEAGRYVFAAPERGWPRGFQEHRIELTMDGARTNLPFFFLNAPKPSGSVEIDSAGCYRQDGMRCFPFGLYQVRVEDMAEVRAHGFDVVHLYAWEKSDDDDACRAYVDACSRHGLKAFVGFPRQRIMDGDFACIARRVGILASHPALFCWYLFDEPALKSQYVSPERLTRFADLIRSLDPYHPVVVTTWEKEMGEYRRSWDVHWSQAYGGEPAYVAHLVDRHREWIGSPSPITLLLNSFDSDQLKARDRKEIERFDFSKFSHDRDFFRACAFLGIVKGCNGIWWWWFGRGDDGYVSVGNHDGAWADLTAVVRELAPYRALAVAEGRVATGVATSGDMAVAKYNDPRVEWWAKTVGEHTTVIAVNVAPHPLEVDLALPDGRQGRHAFKRFEVKVLKFQSKENE